MMRSSKRSAGRELVFVRFQRASEESPPYPFEDVRDDASVSRLGALSDDLDELQREPPKLPPVICPEAADPVARRARRRARRIRVLRRMRRAVAAPIGPCRDFRIPG